MEPYDGFREEEGSSEDTVEPERVGGLLPPPPIPDMRLIPATPISSVCVLIPLELGASAQPDAVLVDSGELAAIVLGARISKKSGGSCCDTFGHTTTHTQKTKWVCCLTMSVTFNFKKLRLSRHTTTATRRNQVL